MRSLLAPLAFCIVAAATTLSAQDSLNWADLSDAEAQSFEDPFVALSDKQIDLLRTIVGARDNLSQGLAPEESLPEIRVRLKEAEDALEQDGIDADGLISQRWIVADKRKAAAMDGNPALDGQTVTIGGFAIPAPPDEDGTPTAYLVEAAGMCSHTPPPLPNQLIKLRLESGWTPDYVHQPVLLTGQMHIASSERELRIVDGDVAMKATWRLDVQEVQSYMPKPDSSGKTSAWAKQLRSQVKSGPDAGGQ